MLRSVFKLCLDLEPPIGHSLSDLIGCNKFENQYKNLLGFLPKGVIRDYDDLEPLGDDYKQAYKPNLTDDEQ